MANGPRICVSVVEGYFAGLKDVGMPLALCVQLQEHKLMFSTAQRTMRQSHAGLSISLFWPSSSVKPVPKKRRRRRRKQPAQLRADSRGCSITEKPPLTPNSDSRPALQSWEKAGIPDSAHSDVSQQQDLSTDPEDPPKHELVDMEPDLTVCENVGYEMRDDVAGLAFAKDGSQGWTPVVHRKKRRQIQKITPTRSTNAESSEEELESCVRKAKQVEYQI